MPKTITENLQTDVRELVASLRAVSFNGHRGKFGLFHLSAASRRLSKFDKRLNVIAQGFFEEIAVAKKMSTIFSCVARLEERLSALINDALIDLDKKKPLRVLRPQFDAIAMIDHCVCKLNNVLSHYLRDNFETIIQELGGELAHDLTVIRDHFSDCVAQLSFTVKDLPDAQLATWQAQLTATVRLSQWLLLATLLKGSFYADVRELIRDLSHYANGYDGHSAHRFNLLPNITLFPPGISVNADLDCILKGSSLASNPLAPLTSRIPKKSEHAPGGSSTFLIDVPVSIEEMSNLDKPAVFGQIVDRISEPTGDAFLLPIMGAVVYLDKNYNLQYAPNVVMLLHEWIHVSHNLQGRNLKNQVLSREEQALWVTMEEYATLWDGPYNESGLLVLYGANPRLAYNAVVSTQPEFYPLLHLDQATDPNILGEPLQAVIEETLKPLHLSSTVAIAPSFLK